MVSRRESQKLDILCPFTDFGNAFVIPNNKLARWPRVVGERRANEVDQRDQRGKGEGEKAIRRHRRELKRMANAAPIVFDGTDAVEDTPFFPGSTSLVSQLDKRIMVILRDGRHLIGSMRSFDQYSNIVLEDTLERHIGGKLYCDIYLGLYVVRGESLVMLAEMEDEEDEDEEGNAEGGEGTSAGTKPSIMQKASIEEVMAAKSAKQDEVIWNFE